MLVEVAQHEANYKELEYYKSEIEELIAITAYDKNIPGGVLHDIKRMKNDYQIMKQDIKLLNL